MADCQVVDDVTIQLPYYFLSDFDLLYAQYLLDAVVWTKLTSGFLGLVLNCILRATPKFSD